jgi:hypothetical protein
MNTTITVLQTPVINPIPVPALPASVQKTTRAQWKGLWHVFREMRHLLGEQEALKLIEKYCRRDALLILQVIL